MNKPLKAWMQQLNSQTSTTTPKPTSWPDGGIGTPIGRPRPFTATDKSIRPIIHVEKRKREQ